ncbi:hypothetical protein [Barnesiella intestinihominis]|uniref:hypothetical protein n=1 Tax=Barnesiella intestinihominis TaxID=487174 RepID=UPI003AB49629
MALNKQIWIPQIKEGFYPNDSFLKRTVDYSGFVDYDILHIASAGIDPKVLVNNTTYPIKIVGREDEDCTAELDKFETENTIVRRPEALEYSYDQLESVIRQHRSTLRTSVSRKAAHAFAPDKDTADTPVITTSGATVNGRKRMTYEDFLTLKERFDEALIPLEDRCIVLHPKHVTDLLLEDVNLFKSLTDTRNGRPFTFAGFDCYQFPYMPTYADDSGTLTKVEFGKDDTEQFASVAFCGSEVMRADGEIYMYSRVDDPEERATIVGFDKRFIALPIRNKGVGAIVSASV